MCPVLINSLIIGDLVVKPMLHDLLTRNISERFIAGTCGKLRPFLTPCNADANFSRPRYVARDLHPYSHKYPGSPTKTNVQKETCYKRNKTKPGF